VVKICGPTRGTRLAGPDFSGEATVARRTSAYCSRLTYLISIIGTCASIEIYKEKDKLFAE
jgi:hypothetical protein